MVPLIGLLGLKLETARVYAGYSFKTIFRIKLFYTNKVIVIVFKFVYKAIVMHTALCSLILFHRKC